MYIDLTRQVALMVEDITIENALGIEDALWIDVRSEGEFAEATIPGAINVPVFENKERAAIGTLYHKAGPDSARRLALELIAPKLPEKITKVDQIAKGKKLVVFCWRGGQRSEFMAGLFDAMGYSVYRVLGGYKSYRRYVNKYFDRQELTQKAIFLYGLTGVGKTDVLRELAQRGMPALDLEGLCHASRVSIRKNRTAAIPLHKRHLKATLLIFSLLSAIAATLLLSVKADA